MVEMSITERSSTTITRACPRKRSANHTDLKVRHAAPFLHMLSVAALADHSTAQRTSPCCRFATEFTPLPATSMFAILEVRSSASAQLMTFVRINKPSERGPSRRKARRSSSPGPIPFQIDPSWLQQRGSCFQRSITCRQHEVPAAFSTHDACGRQGYPLSGPSSSPSFTFLPQRVPSGIPARPDG